MAITALALNGWLSAGTVVDVPNQYQVRLYSVG
jgi:hypothetical protein